MIVKQRPRDSALNRAISGEDAEWGLVEHLLANVLDALETANWQRTDDGVKGINRPKPLPRPGVETPKDEAHFGDASVDIDVMAAWLAKRNPQQHQPA